MPSIQSTSKSATKNNTAANGRKPQVMQATQNQSSHVFTKYVGTVRAKAHSHLSFSLGNFTPNHPAKGFSIALIPNPRDKQAIATEIKADGTPGRYELTLSVINNSNKAVNAEVWQI